MKSSEIRKEAKEYFVPIILGNGSSARGLARRIYRKYGIISLILDEKGSLLQLLDPTNRFFKLTPAKSSAFTALQLLDLASQMPYTLPLLIPCTNKYLKAVEENRELLESSFVISRAETVLSDSPLKIIQN